MSLIANAFDERVVQRMLEFCEDSTPWSRRLWQPGTILIGRELLEAGDPSTSASERAIKTLHDELLGRVTFDAGVCTPADRNATRKLLSTAPASLVKPGYAWRTLEAWVSATNGAYLQTWADALTQGVGLPSAECTARLIAGHLLDEGVSRNLMHRWLTYRIKHDTSVHSLASMCVELNALLARGPRTVEVLVPLAAQAPLPRPAPDGWLSSQQVRDWRAVNVPDWEPIRQYGALLLSIEARDTFAAADAARDRIRAIRDRCLGEVEDLVVDKAEGRARLLSVISGGILGLNCRVQLIPVETVLKVDDRVHVSCIDSDPPIEVGDAGAAHEAATEGSTFTRAYETHGIVPFWEASHRAEPYFHHR